MGEKKKKVQCTNCDFINKKLIVEFVDKNWIKISCPDCGIIIAETQGNFKIIE